MPRKYTPALIAEHLQTLRDSPGRLAACAAGRSEDFLLTPPAPDEWSPGRILAHLRSCAEVWSYSIYAIRLLDDPLMAYIHPRDWTRSQGYAKISFAENYEAFAVGRKTLLRILEGLAYEDWDLAASFVNRKNRLSIFDQTHRMATHEAQHCVQIETIIAQAR